MSAAKPSSPCQDRTFRPPEDVPRRPTTSPACCAGCRRSRWTRSARMSCPGGWRRSAPARPTSASGVPGWPSGRRSSSGCRARARRGLRPVGLDGERLRAASRRPADVGPGPRAVPCREDQPQREAAALQGDASPRGRCASSTGRSWRSAVRGPRFRMGRPRRGRIRRRLDRREVPYRSRPARGRPPDGGAERGPAVRTPGDQGLRLAQARRPREEAESLVRNLFDLSRGAVPGGRPRELVGLARLRRNVPGRRRPGRRNGPTPRDGRAPGSPACQKPLPEGRGVRWPREKPADRAERRVIAGC